MKTIYQVQDRETGMQIDVFDTLEQAQAEIDAYEIDDKKAWIL